MPRIINNFEGLNGLTLVADVANVTRSVANNKLIKDATGNYADTETTRFESYKYSGRFDFQVEYHDVALAPGSGAFFYAANAAGDKYVAGARRNVAGTHRLGFYSWDGTTFTELAADNPNTSTDGWFRLVGNAARTSIQGYYGTNGLTQLYSGDLSTIIGSQVLYVWFGLSGGTTTDHVKFAQLKDNLLSSNLPNIAAGRALMFP